MNNDILYSGYKHMKGEMTSDQFQIFVDYEPNTAELESARACLSSAYEINEFGEPSERSVEIGAKIMGAMGDEMRKENDGSSPHRNWVMMESSILASLLFLQKSPDVRTRS